MIGIITWRLLQDNLYCFTLFSVAELHLYMIILDYLHLDNIKRTNAEPNNG